MSQLVASLQSNLSGIISTGFPLIDTLLTTLVLCNIAAIAAYARYILTEAWIHLRPFLGFDRCVITVKRQDSVPRGWYDEHIMNMDYQALVWYMTTMVSPKRGHMTSLYLKQRDTNDEFEEVFLPARRQMVGVNFQGIAISMYIDNDISIDDKVYRVYNERIVVSSRHGVGMAQLRDFIRHVRSSHVLHKKKQNWRQRLFRLKRDASDTKKGLVWTGALTHSSKTFDTVVLDSSKKKDIVDDIKNYIRSEDWYHTMGLSYKRGYMFYGPPGTGKTSMVLALATEGKRDVYSLDLSKMNSDADLDQAFDQLPDNCLVVLEDVDAMGTTTHTREQRPKDVAPVEVASIEPITADKIMDALMGVEDIRQKNSVSLSALLNHLDGVGSNHGRIFVLTTNHPEVLDPALVRPGRIDMKIYLGLCSREQLRQFFVLYFDGDPDMMNDIPVDVLSPADVSSCFQHFRGKPGLAVEELRRLADNKLAVPTTL
jgi:hypothetical protein